MNIVQQFEDFLKRTEPGPGMAQADDGVPGEASLKLRSIPNVPTARLERRLAVLITYANGTAAPPSGDDSRHQVKDAGMHKLCVLHELKLRNEALFKGLP